MIAGLKAPPRSASKQMDDDLRAQGGLVQSLLMLGDEVEKAARSVRLAIVDVALELDQERRGDRSTLARQNVNVRDFERLADSAISADEGEQAILLHDAIAALTQRLQAVSPAAREYVDQIEQGRRDHRAVTSQVGGGA